MNRIIIYRGLAVVVLLMVASVVRAEIVGIKETNECTELIQKKSVLIDALNNLSSQQASKYFQAGEGKNRFVFCIDPDPFFDDHTLITTQTVLSNTSGYPVIIYGLKVKSSQAPTGQPLLTATGPLLLQNLTATNLRASIVMNGEASIKDSVLSCDTSEGNVYANPILELKGSNERVNKLTITNCKSGISVAGFGNILTDVVITKDEMMTDAIDTGVILGGDNIITSSLPGKSFIGGTIKVTGGNVIISKSILAGDPAVQIAKGLTGVKVTQNTFTKVNTITYLDADDAKAHTLLSAEWMGKKVSETDANYATRVIGKLLNQTNTSKIVEMNKALLKDAGQGSWLSYNYDHTCAVSPAAEDISITLKSNETNIIKKGELYFDCAFEADGSTPLNIPLTAKVRFISNLPEISTMSEDITVADLGGLITIVAIAQPSVPIGSDLTGDVQSDSTGDETPDVPDPTDIGENSGNSGNNATVDGAGSGAPDGFSAGMSPMASCTLSTVGTDQGQTASALVWLLALLPLPLMIPFRSSKKDDE